MGQTDVALITHEALLSLGWRHEGGCPPIIYYTKDGDTLSLTWGIAYIEGKGPHTLSELKSLSHA